MLNNNDTDPGTDPERDQAGHAPQPTDLALGFTEVTDVVGRLIGTVESDHPEALSTFVPSCPEFTVADLLDHLVMVIRRAGHIADGGHWSEVGQEVLGSGRARAFADARLEADSAWSDPAKLGSTFEVPWGQMPGAGVLATYTAEVAVHGWDLANAIGLSLAVHDRYLDAPLKAVHFIPAEGRNSAEVPFGAVVDPGPGASRLDQIAGWMGRPVGD